jgi:hypothetical protein
MKKEFNKQDSYIDLNVLAKVIIKEKIILFFILLISIITALTYSLLITKKFSTHVIINDPGNIFFVKINKILENYSNEEIFKIKDLSENINNEILSNNNISTFLSNNKNFQSSQINQISIKKLTIDRKLIPNGFQLIYTEKVDGLKLLNEYIQFTQSKIINDYNQKINIVLEYYIEYLNDQKKIAESIELELPFNRNNSNYSGPLDDKYAVGTKILSEKILIAEKVKQSIALNSLSYEIFFERASNQSLHSANKIKITFVGLLIGLFMSFLLILFKLNETKILK